MFKKLALVGALWLVLAASSGAGPNTSIIFDAFDVDAVTFVYCDTSAPQGLTCATGAADDDGWLRVRGLGAKLVVIRPDAIALGAGTVQFTIEGRTQDSTGAYATMDLIAPIDFAAAQAGKPVAIVELVDEIRVGVRINGADDGDAVDDSITVHVDGGQ